MNRPISNVEIADVLDRVADLLEAQDANVYRVRAYRTAAESIRSHEAPLAEVLSLGGVEAIDAIPSIGPTIASHVAELVRRKELSYLDRLEGEVSPERLLATVPGLGPALARRVHEDLHVDTLEELEVAAHDGRLESLHGFGPRRVRSIRESLQSILGRSTRHRARRRAWMEAQAGGRSTPGRVPQPVVATLLDVDAMYRRQAEEGELPLISPRRLNPDHEAWLPVLHTERDGWHFTALFSNTARAHRLGKTRDWVVLFYSQNGEEGQCTVVTERSGRLTGRRVIRGREAECLIHYRDQDAVSSETAPSSAVP